MEFRFLLAWMAQFITQKYFTVVSSYSYVHVVLKVSNHRSGHWRSDLAIQVSDWRIIDVLIQVRSLSED